MPLPEQLDTTVFHSLSLVQVGHEWQANLNVEGGSNWRIRAGATPSEALAALFEPCPAALPPLPY